MKKWIFIGVGALLFLGLSIGITLFIVGAFSQEPKTGAAMSDETVIPRANEAIIRDQREIFYHFIQPEFVVNFHTKVRPRALMIEITVSSYNEKSLELLETHSPELRNNLLLVMAEENGANLATTTGKNELREKLKNTLNELLRKHSGFETIEEVYLTRFVLQ